MARSKREWRGSVFRAARGDPLRVPEKSQGDLIVVFPSSGRFERSRGWRLFWSEGLVGSDGGSERCGEEGEDGESG